MSAEQVAQEFIQFYYGTREGNPQGIGALYQDQSVLTFEGQRYEGPNQITEKLVGIGKVEHTKESFTVDIQLGADSNALLIFVVGQIKISDGNPLHFTQIFQLLATGPGQYYVHNEIFRLVYA